MGRWTVDDGTVDGGTVNDGTVNGGRVGGTVDGGRGTVGLGGGSFKTVNYRYGSKNKPPQLVTGVGDKNGLKERATRKDEDDM